MVILSHLHLAFLAMLALASLGRRQQLLVIKEEMLGFMMVAR
jgi:hypothetical protein